MPKDLIPTMKHLGPIIALVSCASMLNACAAEQNESTQVEEPKERAPRKVMTQAEEAAFIAERMPPEMFGDPTLTQEEKVQRSIDMQMAQIKAAGDGDELTADAEGLAQAWSKLGRASVVKFTVTDPECFKNGCVVVTRHASNERLDAILTDLTHTEGFNRWNSGKFRSGLQNLKNGDIQVTWIFHAPPQGEPVMQPKPPEGDFEETREGIGHNEQAEE